VPWCEPCGRYFNPNSLHDDGTCPVCGEQVGDPDSGGDQDPVPKIPWHFWVLVIAAAAYLGWRALQGALLLF
jgi:hypothetical protein